MSDLSFVEKRKFEELLGMSSGYVAEFSNRSFAELVRDSTGRNIFDPRYEYASGSKANRLRAFWQKEDNRTVAKLMTDILDCCSFDGPLKLQCRQIIARLRGETPDRSTTEKPNQQPSEKAAEHPSRSKALAALRDEFYRLATETDRNKAGLTLERLLNQVFEAFQLKPRQPFRVVGEQIDGSFDLDGQVYLLESKWENHALSEAPLLVFRGKIEGKSTFTRGVFIALNDVTAAARDSITRGKAPCFFIMNGHDLMMILSEAILLTDFLRRRVRLLAEEGRVSVPFSELT